MLPAQLLCSLNLFRGSGLLFKMLPFGYYFGGFFLFGFFCRDANDPRVLFGEESACFAACQEVL